jgi:uncharacterized protein YifN (PemK superfamily)
MSETNINLINIVNEQSDDIEDEAPNVLQHSLYYDTDGLTDMLSRLPNTFKILSLNVQSINAKFHELQAYVEGVCNSNFSAVCIQETWLSDESDVSLLQLNGYNLISKGKSSSLHGGVAIYLKENFRYKILNISSQSNIWDGIFIELLPHESLHHHFSKPLIIGCIYRPPRDNSTNYNCFISELDQILHDLQRNNNEVAITGDFNIDLLKIRHKANFNDFFETMLSNGYIPKITLPTRLSHHSSTLIDNIFVRMSDNFSATTAGVVMANISDHLPCFVSLDYLVINKSCQKYIKIWSRSENSLYNFKNEVSRNCDIENFHYTGITGPNLNYNILNDKIQEAYKIHVPVEVVRFNKHHHKHSKWITSGILSSIKFRDKLYKRLRETNPESNKYQVYKSNLSMYNVILKKLIRTAKKSYFESCFNKFRNDVKKTWNTIKSILNKDNTKKDFPEKFLINGTYTSDAQVIVNKFNEYFTNIGSELYRTIAVPQNKSFENYLQSPCGQTFSFSEVNEETVSKIIDNLKPKCSSGVDGVSNKLLKYIKNEILAPLTLIVNQAITFGVFPDKLKIAKVVPLYKKAESHLFQNYRPISVLPSISKVLERVMHSQIVAHFTNNKLFYDNQYGFRTSHSTELAALELVNRVTDCMDKNELPLSIFLDMSKAFDTIDHSILLYKLRYYGLSDNALKLVETYLCNRMQYVSMDNLNSSMLPISIGVPQGSILGPLFFIIYVNDLHSACDLFHPIIYADDSTLSASLRTFGPAGQDRDRYINNELDKVSTWLKLNKLSLNSSKTKAILFHTARKSVTYPSIKIDNVAIEYVDSFDYLGITLDKHLNWKPHIEKISMKMSKVVGIVSRMKNLLPGNVLLTLYNSLFLPYLNYGILCWKSRINAIFKLQKKIIRIVSGEKYNAHTEPLFKNLRLLKADDLCTLQFWKFCYKLENYLLPNYFYANLFAKNIHIHRHNTRNANDYHIPRVKHEFAKHCIQYTIPIAYNNCPKLIRDKIHTHSMAGFIKYIKCYFIDSYEVNCTIVNCYVCQT